MDDNSYKIKRISPLFFHAQIISNIPKKNPSLMAKPHPLEIPHGGWSRRARIKDTRAANDARAAKVLAAKRGICKRRMWMWVFLSQVLLEMLFGCLLFDFCMKLSRWRFFGTEAVAAGLIITCIYIYSNIYIYMCIIIISLCLSYDLQSMRSLSKGCLTPKLTPSQVGMGTLHVFQLAFLQGCFHDLMIFTRTQVTSFLWGWPSILWVKSSKHWSFEF